MGMPKKFPVFALKAALSLPKTRHETMRKARNFQVRSCEPQPDPWMSSLDIIVPFGRTNVVVASRSRPVSLALFRR